MPLSSPPLVSVSGRRCASQKAAVEDARVQRVHRKVNGPGFFAAEENVFPGLAAIPRAKNAALSICAVGA